MGHMARPKSDSCSPYFSYAQRIKNTEFLYSSQRIKTLSSLYSFLDTVPSRAFIVM
jgi:hypothetical protein